LTGNDYIDALLTEWKWDTTNLTYSFPDSGIWYLLESIVDDLDPLDILDIALELAANPATSLVNLLEELILGPFGDTLIVSFFALNDFGEFTASQQAAAEAALANLEAFSLLNLTEVDEGDFVFEIEFDDLTGLIPVGIDFGFTHGLIRYAESGAISASAPGFGIPPLPTAEILIGEGILGDTWYLSDGSFDNAPPGSFAAFTIMHETGHAIGLKHAHEEGLLGGNVPGVIEDVLTGVSGPIMPQDKESVEFTIMSYLSTVGQTTPGYTNEANGFPTTFMMLDIQALQYMYGANYTTNATDTTYSWDPNTGTMSINGAAQLQPGANRVFLTIWDGGGNDTYDLSNYTTDAFINLLPGEWTKTADNQLADLTRGDDRSNGLAKGNVANALLFNDDPRSLIENGFGGSGNDTIKGNTVSNLLRGNGGNDNITGDLGQDTLEGGAGNDTLDGGADNDSLLGAEGNDSITGGDGDDTINAGSENDTALGGTGRDTIYGGEGGDSLDGGSENDTLHGEGGNDTVSGGDGDDSVFGGTGSDNLFGGTGLDTLFGAEGGDTIDGGDGNDTLTGDAGDDSIIAGAGDDTVTGSDGFDTLTGGAGFDTLDGGAQDDFLDGGDNNDLLTAGTGNDTVLAGAGNDHATGGDGNDSMSGEAGVDTLDGGLGNDTIFGGADDDTIVGGLGLDVLDGGTGADFLDAGFDNDTVFGGDNNDTILGGEGADSLDGGSGGDAIDAGSGNDTVLGGDGNDTILGGDGDDTVDGNAGDDVIHGGAGIDSLRGGEGNDDIFGEGDNDSLFGDAGNDTLAGGSGQDTVNGGDGIDMASYSDATGPVVINLQDSSQTTGDAAGDVLISIEQFGLSNFDDTFIGLDDPLIPDIVFGRGGNDTLSGFAGNDSLYGEAGDDFIVGGMGADLIDGGDGFDTTSFLESKTGIVVDLVNPSRNTGIASGDQIVSIEQFHMTTQKDEFVGLEVGETIHAYHGNDMILGNGGDDVVFGGGQHDFLSGGTGNDTLLGEMGSDTLLGGENNDSLSGGADIDVLMGGAGSDTLSGGDGNDRLAGDIGDDLMWGDLGRDDFVFTASNWGKDTIVDFEDGSDWIVIEGLPSGPGKKHAMGDLLIFERVGVGSFETVIHLASGGPDEIVLLGIHAQQLSHHDFQF
jgi:Ca2+-binding RTX toxin-like protein